MGAHLAESEERRAAGLTFIERVRARLAVLPFGEAEATEHARIWALVRRAGTPVGERDLQIASTALVHGHTVLTRNVREFAPVPGLAVASPG